MKAFLSARHASPILVPLLVLFLSCGDDNTASPGGGGGGGGSNPTSGVFVDSPVQGLDYASGGVSGVTGATGGFKWEKGSDIQFSVGDIDLEAAVQPATIMSPFSLSGSGNINDPIAINLARFLQTIDDDGNPANGIVITPAVRAAAAGQSVFFNQSIGNFENDPDVLAAVDSLTSATSAGPRPLVDTAAAQAQLAASVQAAYAGNYKGNYCIDGSGGGPETLGGTWTMTVAADGTATLRFTGKVVFSVTGMLSLNGAFDVFAGGVSVFAGFGPDFGGRYYTETTSGSFSQSSTCVD